MIEDDLPKNWGPHRGRLSLHQRKIRGRKSWFVRMAMQGFVPAPGVKSGKKQLVAAALPELFDSAGQVRDHQRERWDLLEPNGMPIGKLRQLRVKVPGSSVWVPVLVKARTDNAAARLLAGALPEGTEIEVDIRGQTRAPD